MNWLDGIIGFISPEWGARREAWRQSLTEMRNYDAGKAGITDAADNGETSGSKVTYTPAGFAAKAAAAGDAKILVKIG